MSKHQRNQHGRGPLRELTHRICNVQTLFQGLGKAYFEVQVDLKEGEGSDLRDALIKVGVSSDGNGEAAIATDNDRTPPALLRVTGWSDHLPNVRANKTLRANALALKASRKPHELGGILAGLDAAVNAIFELGRTLLNGHSSKLTVLKLLMHGEDVPSEG
jgi:hypothetical protein